MFEDCAQCFLHGRQVSTTFALSQQTAKANRFECGNRETWRSGSALIGRVSHLLCGNNPEGSAPKNVLAFVGKLTSTQDSIQDIASVSEIIKQSAVAENL